MNDELRELVAQEIARFLGDEHLLRVRPIYQEEADRILAIPRIAAALKLLDEQERLMLGSTVSTGVK